jgi:hypothetical protein
MVYEAKATSKADKLEVSRRLVREAESLANHAADRVISRKLYFVQRPSVETILSEADWLRRGVAVVEREDEVTTMLMQRGK